jgi:hypothetical protein
MSLEPNIYLVIFSVLYTFIKIHGSFLYDCANCKGSLFKDVEAQTQISSCTYISEITFIHTQWPKSQLTG